MIDLSPAPVAPVVETPAASPVTTQTSAEQTAPQADKPAGTEQEATASEQPEKADPSQDEAKKSWKEKRQERNRERWQEFKRAKDYTIRSLEAEVQRLRAKEAPDLSRITDPDEAVAERTAWKLQQSSVAEKEQTLQQERESRAQAHQQAIREAWQDIADDARERMPNFDNAFARTPIHERFVPHLVESEKAADLAIFLGNNPKEAQALFEQFETAPARALIELGRIEARLSAPKAKTVSTAPKPAPVLTGGSNPLQFDMSRASVEDVAAQLRKGGHIR